MARRTGHEPRFVRQGQQPIHASGAKGAPAPDGEWTGTHAIAGAVCVFYVERTEMEPRGPCRPKNELKTAQKRKNGAETTNHANFADGGPESVSIRVHQWLKFWIFGLEEPREAEKASEMA